MIGIILLGESNSGKSTLGKGLINKYKEPLRYISSGDIAREIADKSLLDAGNLAPEDIMRSEILGKINEDNASFILDGCPRFYDQYEWLNKSVSCTLLYFIIDVPHEQIVKRAELRGRSDDKSLEKKYEFYKNETLPMIKRIIESGELVYTFDNSDDVNIYETVKSMQKILEEYE